MTTQPTQTELPVVRSVRHKTTAAALLALGCELHGIRDAEDGWCEIEVRVPPALDDAAQKIIGDGRGVQVEWGAFRDCLRDISAQITEHINERRREQ